MKDTIEKFKKKYGEGTAADLDYGKLLIIGLLIYIAFFKQMMFNNPKPYKGPPYLYSVKIKGVKGARRMQGFDEQHIQEQVKPRKVTYCKKLKDG